MSLVIAPERNDQQDFGSHQCHQDYRDHPAEIFSYATLKLGGVFYGGFLEALFYTVWFVHVRKLSFWKLADLLVPSVAIGTTVTRLGCFGAG